MGLRLEPLTWSAHGNNVLPLRVYTLRVYTLRISSALHREVSHMGVCGSLNVTGLHKLIGSSTIRRCGFFGVGVTLLEEVCHYGGGL